ncbi:MAG TPA: 2OG-Fe(II) oxygenase [Candidatus Binataceae bacterium]
MPQIRARIAALDWKRIGRELDERGFAAAGRVLEPAECAELIALYTERERFRNRIVMVRLGYGRGEYKYFARPLPRVVQDLRSALYSKLAPVANRWAGALGASERFPPALAGFLERCASNGQLKPTPLVLRYEAGGFNCLHQDVYGSVAFPLQFTCMLSRLGRDYKGGELLFVEQRPRAQSRGDALTLAEGEAVVFANRYRPVAGARGYYRTTMRHGVTTITSGVRFALGVIFHDAE